MADWSLNADLDRVCEEKRVNLKKCAVVELGDGGEVNFGYVECKGCPKENMLKKYGAAETTSAKVREYMRKSVALLKCEAVGVGGWCGSECWKCGDSSVSQRKSWRKLSKK